MRAIGRHLSLLSFIRLAIKFNKRNHLTIFWHCYSFRIWSSPTWLSKKRAEPGSSTQSLLCLCAISGIACLWPRGTMWKPMWWSSCTRPGQTSVRSKCSSCLQREWVIMEQLLDHMNNFCTEKAIEVLPLSVHLPRSLFNMLWQVSVNWKLRD